MRLAAYAVCIEDGRVLLARHISAQGESTWTLPGGRVEHAEDPLDTVIRVDVGLALARTAPPTGHTAPVPTGGLIQH